MDSHYHQVMKAREGITDAGTKLYFAYSAVLDRVAFEQWRTEHSYPFFILPEGQIAQASNVDLIFDFPSRWWGGRVAGLVDKAGSQIYGRVFEIPSKDWPVVQHKEGVVTGMSIERPIQITVEGQELAATAFVTNPTRASTLGPVSERFVAALISGAQQAGLPPNYISSLKTKVI